MDLYETLKEKQVSWNELKAAVVDEYSYLGKPTKELGDLRSPFGNWIFPHAIPEEKRLPYPENALLLITRDDATGELVHDDLLVSAAMCYALDGQMWGLAESEVIEGFDPIEGMREVF